MLIWNPNQLKTEAFPKFRIQGPTQASNNYELQQEEEVMPRRQYGIASQIIWSGNPTSGVTQDVLVLSPG